MTTPALLFGSLVAVLIGVLFHLVKGGGPFYILLYMVASVLGFWVGQKCAEYLDLRFWTYGPVSYGPAILSAVIFLLITSWLFNKAQLQQNNNVDAGKK